jgi:hypothetical protein
LTEQNRLVAEVGLIYHVFASQWMFFQQRQQNALAPERHALSFKQRELSAAVSVAVLKCSVFFLAFVPIHTDAEMCVVNWGRGDSANSALVKW